MSEYQVLARKHRPQKFKDVVAQDAIVATLKNAIRHSRAAHAYLFSGCRGTGKTTLARLFAKALNCPHLTTDIEPCNACSSCHDITGSHAIDVLEIDGASHRGIEDIRQINETIGFAPASGRYKIYLIDEVHMLTKEAFNALLKTLEEPPYHVKFFFCTTEPHKIPATILSRCQKFNLKRISAEKIRGKMTEIAQELKIQIDREALEYIAEMAEGSLRDALSLLDQIIAFEKAEITSHTVAEVLGLPSKEILFSLDEAGKNGGLAEAFRIAREIFGSGINISHFLDELLSHFRLLFLIKHGTAHSGPHATHYHETCSIYRPEQLMQILEFISEAQQNLKFAPSEKTALEMLLLRILRSHKQLSLESLVARLIELEEKLSFSEDPIAKVDSLVESPTSSAQSSPSVKKKSQVPSKPMAHFSPESVPKSTPNPVLQYQPLSIQEQSRFDTIMRFAAKELNGSLKKE